MTNEWPLVRVVGPTVLARAMEALLAENGVPISSDLSGVLLLLPGGNGKEAAETAAAKAYKEGDKARSAIRMADNLLGVEERTLCSLPGVCVRAVVSVDDPVSCILDALRAVAQDEVYCSPRLLPDLLNYMHHPTLQDKPDALSKSPIEPALSHRELSVARCAAQGMSNEEIAQSLHISVATVKFHLSHIFQKLGISRRSQIEGTLHS